MKRYNKPEIEVVEMEQDTPILSGSINAGNHRPNKDNNMNIFSIGNQTNPGIWDAAEDQQTDNRSKTY